MIGSCLIAFFGGAFYEAIAVAWVHYESLKSRAAACAFVLGYGCGTWIAVKVKA